jgi:hypothetical protein
LNDALSIPLRQPEATRFLQANFLFLLALVIVFGSPRAFGAGQLPQAIDLSGNRANVFDTETNQAFVLIFVSCECPISNRYAPELRRLREKFQAIPFRLVYPNRDESAETVRVHTNQFQLAMGAVRDPQHVLVKRSKATVIPEAAVFSRSGDLLYHGRIDDRYVALGKERPQATEHTLETILQKIVDGQRVRPSSQRPIGCFIAEP